MTPQPQYVVTHDFLVALIERLQKMPHRKVDKLIREIMVTLSRPVQVKPTETPTPAE
jgi:hypothetical protein